MFQKNTLLFMYREFMQKPNGRGVGEKYLGDEWEVLSAGIEAHGLNPNVVKAMKEVGIDISDQTIEQSFVKLN